MSTFSGMRAILWLPSRLNCAAHLWNPVTNAKLVNSWWLKTYPGAKRCPGQHSAILCAALTRDFVSVGVMPQKSLSSRYFPFSMLELPYEVRLTDFVAFNSLCDSIEMVRGWKHTFSHGPSLLHPYPAKWVPQTQNTQISRSQHFGIAAVQPAKHVDTLPWDLPSDDQHISTNTV